MKFLSSFAAAAALAAGVATLAPAPASAYPSPISVTSCSVIKPKPMSTKASGTHIVYVNHGPKTAKDITFAVAYRNAQSNYLRRVTDVGTFSPGATISHNLSLYNDITYAGTATLGCEAIKVVWSDGTVWQK